MISRRIAALLLFVTIACVAGAGILRARGQATARPGDPTQAHVWVDNRNPNEAIPVIVEGLPSPVPVRLEAQTVVRTMAVPQNWEYRTVQLQAASNGSALGAVGNDGWEAVGVLRADASGATILFKRPR